MALVPYLHSQNKTTKLLETKSVAQWIISVMNSISIKKTNVLREEFEDPQVQLHIF
jgi:hypothetical protein